MPAARPTLRAVAALAGVSAAAASRALAENLRIAAATRARVRAAAEKLGYRAHPLLRALFRAQRSGKRGGGAPRLAWIGATCGTESTWTARCRLSATAEAELLGYQLESVARETTALAGVAGVLWAPGAELDPALLTILAEGRAECLRLGYASDGPIAVAPDVYRATLEAAARTHEAGARRPAVIIVGRGDDAALALVEAAASRLVEQDGFKVWRAAFWDAGAIAAWWREHRPDAIVVAGAGTELAAWLDGPAAAGKKLLMVLEVTPFAASPWPGLRLAPEEAGRLAVHLLGDAIQRDAARDAAAGRSIRLPVTWEAADAMVRAEDLGRPAEWRERPRRGRPTLHEVARHARCDISTVSLALRADERISAATQARVHEAALRVGYRLPPEQAMLRAKHGSAGLRGVFAFVTQAATRDGWRDWWKQAIFEGAAEQAARHGYKVEPVWATEPGMNVARLEKILHTRRVQGLLFPPLDLGHRALPLDLARYAAVTVGAGVAPWPLHQVVPAMRDAISLAWTEAEARGYRRLGLVMSVESAARHLGLGPACFAARTVRAAETDGRKRSEIASGLPPFIFEDWDERAFATWRRRERPDALIYVGPVVEVLPAAVKRTGRGGPDDLGLIDLNTWPKRGISGVYQSPELIGAAAADLVVDLVRRGERGVPPAPLEFHTPVRWFEGTTVRGRTG